jgi:hypothetical protein
MSVYSVVVGFQSSAGRIGLVTSILQGRRNGDED